MTSKSDCFFNSFGKLQKQLRTLANSFERFEILMNEPLNFYDRPFIEKILNVFLFGIGGEGSVGGAKAARMLPPPFHPLSCRPFFLGKDRKRESLDHHQNLIVSALDHFQSLLSPTLPPKDFIENAQLSL